MAYIALYRKWRPKVFEDVLGQEHITQTLKNQIKNNNIAHAYLFCGTRGTGKTSLAKIFARAVNCVNPYEQNPCNKCELCMGIQQESIMDVIEIDAASNNGVDNIRELRENVKYPPANGKYKVYIIDEVHMLSTGAFNALLKTLEEPPHFVIFILATTEPHKIPPTILSRCQRFDLKRIKEAQMVEGLAYICKQMNRKVEEEALYLIARNSDGSMRDALSILDQCISFSLDKVSYDDVIDILGIASSELMFHIVDHIIHSDAEGAMGLIEELVQSGKDLQQFIKDLIGHYRNLMMTKVASQLEGIINLSKESIERMKAQGEKLETNEIIRGIHILSETEAEAKRSTQPRILLEMAVIKMINPVQDQSVEGLRARIAALEKAIQKGIMPVAQPATPMKAAKEATEEVIALKDVPAKPPLSKEIDHARIIDFAVFEKAWEDILKEIKKRKISVYAWVMEGKPAAMEKNTLLIAFGDRFSLHKEATGKSPNKEFIEEVIEAVTGERILIKAVMEDEIEILSEATDEISISEEDEEVKKIIEMFGEDLVEIEE